MKISINIDDSFQTDEIVINSKCLTPELERIISTIRLIEQQMTVTKNNEMFFIDVMSIIYVESVDRKTFVYTDNDCYKTKLRLYEMEEQLLHYGFIRISKSSLVQLNFIRSVRVEINRKLRLTLENGEQLIVSRAYSEQLKQNLGVQ
ncbi:MAG: LytTR family transcriptional regulator DNA-binding domain-containing protein [Lachnospiraceae bacterium]|nr:LytTR family transcriptional regulator DNA-binding domain-containing protein [Lachnospiraceae bacterium]